MATKTGTFQQIYQHLSDSERYVIVDELMQHLGKKREKVTFQVRGVDRLVFRLPQYILLGTPKPAPDAFTGIVSCSTATEIWDRIWKPSLEANRVPKDEYEFLRRTMPRDGIFTYAQMDLRSANILVEDGHFSGFASEYLAGYFPVWFQNVAIATIHHPIEHPEEGREDEEEANLYWYKALLEWEGDERNQDNPLADSHWGLHAIHVPNIEYGRWWFEYWYLIQVEKGDPGHWRTGIAALADYLQDKEPKDVERADFFNYMKERCKLVD